MKRYDVRGKNVLITGASSGIGKELSECFARNGANLLLSAIPAEEDILKDWAGELEDRYKVWTWTRTGDLAKFDGPEKLYRQAAKAVPQIDVLVNNAGILVYGKLHELPVRNQEKVIRVNLLAHMKLMALALPAMVERGSGRILNVVSVSAFSATPFHAVYGATKAAMLNLSLATAEEVRESGVTVCTLNPSYVDTPMVRDNMPESIRWFSVSGKSSPRQIAEQGFEAFLKGKLIYIPGFKNRLIHGYFGHIMPKAVQSRLAYNSLQ